MFLHLQVKQYLVTHIKNVHGKSAEVNFQCDQCTKTFSTERYMKTHKVKKCTSLGPVTTREKI